MVRFSSPSETTVKEMNVASLTDKLDSVTEIVITGGPCAGKTTAMAFLQQKLTEYGFRVLVAPETATILITGGVHDMVDLAMNDPEMYFEVQRELLRMQRAIRDQFRRLANSFVREREERVVILFDRGESDNTAYIGKAEWEALLAEERLTSFDVRDDYDAVIHLTTVAKGKPELYTTENNAARQESVEQAIEMDDRTLAGWVGHPHLRIIDNEPDGGFDGKLRRALAAAARAVGFPAPVEIERKFLLAEAPDAATLPAAKRFEIEQTYLVSANPDREVRVRRRSDEHGNATYYRTEKVRLSAAVREEVERIISAREYLRLLSQADPERKPIRKTRYCFAYAAQQFELDVYHDLELAVLEAELTDETDALELPPFVAVEREVTGEREFSNASLAERI